MSATSGMRETQKRAAAQAALDLVVEGTVLGVGSGSTAEAFIDELAASGIELAGTVASSERTAGLLARAGFSVLDLREVGQLPVYVDGADEADDKLHLIKGGGGALTREKIVAASSDLFVCIIDESKLVERLGAFPLAVEVVPMAEVHVTRRLTRMGGQPALREGFTTDNGNVIVDVTGLSFRDPLELESRLDAIAGVVCNGVFARRPADVLLVGTAAGVERFERPRV